MRHLTHWTRAGLLDLPPHTKTAWQSTKLATDDAQAILDYACWPRRKPSGDKPIEVSENGVTLFELVGAMQVAHNRRRKALKRSEVNTLRKMVKNALSGKIICDGKLNDLYESLGIKI